MAKQREQTAYDKAVSVFWRVAPWVGLVAMTERKVLLEETGIGLQTARQAPGKPAAVRILVPFA